MKEKEGPLCLDPDLLFGTGQQHSEVAMPKVPRDREVTVSRNLSLTELLWIQISPEQLRPCQPGGSLSCPLSSLTQTQETAKPYRRVVQTLKKFRVEDLLHSKLIRDDQSLKWQF